MKKVLCIVGPTASGKTGLAIALAKKFRGILVNFDSIQVYQGCSIISGKDIPRGVPFQIDSEKLGINLEELRQRFPDKKIGYYILDSIPIFLLDIVPPTYSFHVRDFTDLAMPTISSIQAAGFLPILVGGTAFYLKTLLDGAETSYIPPNETLRRQWSGKSVPELSKFLEEKNRARFEQMNDSDRKNPRRLIRALEIDAYQTLYGNVPETPTALSQKNYVLILGLSLPKDSLKENIQARIRKRLEDGALSESKQLFKQFDALSSQIKTACGYQQFFSYLKGEISFDTAEKQWLSDEVGLTKRQMTFFKKDKRTRWFDALNTSLFNEVENNVSGWYNENTPYISDVVKKVK